MILCCFHHQLQNLAFHPAQVYYMGPTIVCMARYVESEESAMFPMYVEIPPRDNLAISPPLTPQELVVHNGEDWLKYQANILNRVTVYRKVKPRWLYTNRQNAVVTLQGQWIWPITGWKDSYWVFIHSSLQTSLWEVGLIENAWTPNILQLCYSSVVRLRWTHENSCSWMMYVFQDDCHLVDSLSN